ncbi:uncharacterized protein Tco025E_03795 [Trypanosoma conorhini]|uniref:Uncharacterized protein n=1 Tax=Trypanosoma conorhini TaxID=83891 RepID=A0A3R7LBT3_9TRYP|nr:uncharacterized protein Tco025E_03795 [Trypanosoma conorhini]RNF20340.1 hypothetical protein Tco025E_03795 [Trypanosoma conorhini]
MHTPVRILVGVGRPHPEEPPQYHFLGYLTDNGSKADGTVRLQPFRRLTRFQEWDDGRSSPLGRDDSCRPTVIYASEKKSETLRRQMSQCLTVDFVRSGGLAKRCTTQRSKQFRFAKRGIERGGGRAYRRRGGRLAGVLRPRRGGKRKT